MILEIGQLEAWVSFYLFFLFQFYFPLLPISEFRLLEFMVSVSFFFILNELTSRSSLKHLKNSIILSPTKISRLGLLFPLIY